MSDIITSDPLINIVGLNKSYKDTKVLHDINLSINKGEIFGIIGKSGAGKSTLLKCLNLLEMPSTGQIIIDQIDISTLNKLELRRLRQNIGVIFQNFNLLYSKTVFANIALPLILQKKYPSHIIKDKVSSLIQLVGLNGLENAYPKDLSGGQKQRVGIARSLAVNPKILLSDEATSALDTETTNSILELLIDINKKLGLTIVLITHEMDVVRKVCDRVAVIESGKIIENDTTINIILNPKMPLTKNLVSYETNIAYLQYIKDFYINEENVSTTNNSTTKSLVLLKFIGMQTFEPILYKLSHKTNIEFNILRGELDRIKYTPFGKLLIEILGTQSQINDALLLLRGFNIDYEIISNY